MQVCGTYLCNSISLVLAVPNFAIVKHRRARHLWKGSPGPQLTVRGAYCTSTLAAPQGEDERLRSPGSCGRFGNRRSRSRGRICAGFFIYCAAAGGPAVGPYPTPSQSTGRPSVPPSVLVAFRLPCTYNLAHESYRRDLASRVLPDSNSATFPSPRPPRMKSWCRWKPSASTLPMSSAPSAAIPPGPTRPTSWDASLPASPKRGSRVMGYAQQSACAEYVAVAEGYYWPQPEGWSVVPVRRLPGQLPHRVAALLEGGTAGRIHRARPGAPESPPPRAHPRRRRRRRHGRRAARPHPGL